MVDEDKLCDSKDRPSFDLTWSVGVFSFVVPFMLAFCAFFSYKLRTETAKNPLRTRVEAYNALAVTFTLAGFYIFLIDPIRQRSHGISIPFCCTLSWIIWFLPGATYLTLQNVLLTRLKMAFNTTSFEVPELVIKAWNSFHVCCLLILAVLLTIRNAQVDCYIEREVKGALMNRTVLWCSVKHNDYLQTTVVFGAIFAILGGNLLLSYMYIWRMKAAMFPKQNEHLGARSNAGDMKALERIRKSTVVAIYSIVTSFLGFIGTALNMYLITYVDVILNVIFLYTLFKFGSDVYVCVFGKCDFVADCCMPEDALQLEKDLKHKQTRHMLVDASGNPQLPLGPRVLSGYRAKTAELLSTVEEEAIRNSLKRVDSDSGDDAEKGTEVEIVDFASSEPVTE